MHPDRPDKILTREEHPEAIVFRIAIPQLREGEQLEALKDALSQETQSVDQTLVVDLAAVEFLTSAALGWLVTLRHELRQQRSIQPPGRRRGQFALFPNTAAALEAIRLGESDPLVLCGARREVAEVFHVC